MICLCSGVGACNCPASSAEGTRLVNGDTYVDAKLSQKHHPITTLQHLKTSNCPACNRVITFGSDTIDWTDAEWESAFRDIAGWIRMRGAVGRSVWVCSDKCARKAAARMSA